MMKSLFSPLCKLKSAIENDKTLIEIREKIRKVAENQLENGIITAVEYLSEFNNENVARQTLNLHQVQLAQNQYNIKLSLGL